MLRRLVLLIYLFSISFSISGQGWMDHSIVDSLIGFTPYHTSAGIDGDYYAYGDHTDSVGIDDQSALIRAGAVHIYKRDDAGIWSFYQKIVPETRSEQAQFGEVISFQDSTLFVSARLESYFVSGANFMEQGAVYVFELSEDGIWEQSQRIQPSLTQNYAEFGTSISLFGDEVIISAPHYSLNIWYPPHGAVFVFRRDESGLWEEVQAIVSGAGADGEAFVYDSNFGDAVAHDSLTLVIGCPETSLYDENSGDLIFFDTGSVFIYEKSAFGVWEFQQRIVKDEPEEYDEFGIEVAVSGNQIFIRSMDFFYPDSETDITVYEKEESEWVEEQVISFPSGSNYHFNDGVKIKDGLLAVYSHSNNFSSSNGSIRFYEESEDIDDDGDSDWELIQNVSTPLYRCEGFDFDEDQLLVNSLVFHYNNSPTQYDSISARIVVYDKCVTQTTDLDIVACDTYTSPSGWTYDTSNVFVDYVNINQSCFDIYNINLDLRYSNQGFKWRSACDSFESFSGEYLWTASGVYKDTITNVAGCDSVLTVFLTIENDSISISTEACDSLQWIENNAVYYESGSYLAILENGFGCDSLVTMNLEIHHSEYLEEINDVCGPYESPSGNYSWIESGNYQDTTFNSYGCPVFHDLTLSIEASPFDSISAQACEWYQSPSGLHYWMASGHYVDMVPSDLNCDSLIYVDLEILQPTSSIVDTSNCMGITSPSGSFFWDEPGQYFDTLINEEGCDSVITINLEVPAIYTNVAIVGGDSLLSLAYDASAYQWLDCGDNYATIEGATAQGFGPDESGSYAVAVSEFGCTDTSNCKTITVVGLNDIVGQATFTVFPNPSSASFVITLSEIYQSAILNLYDLQGRLVFSEKVGESNKVIFEPRVGNGTYILRLYKDDIILGETRLVVVD